MFGGLIVFPQVVSDRSRGRPPDLPVRPHPYSRALAGWRTLAEVLDAASHTTLLTTSVYLHVAVDDDGSLGNLFAAGR